MDNELKAIQEMARTICVPAKVENAECDSCTAKASGACVMTEIVNELYKADYRKADDMLNGIIDYILEQSKVDKEANTNESKDSELMWDISILWAIEKIKEAASLKYDVEVKR